MADDPLLQPLIDWRDRTRERFVSLGDLRPGTLSSNWRKCGKPGCHCAREGAKGHGPSYVLVRSVKGKTRSVRIGPDDLDEVRRQVAEYGRFRELASEFLEASEALAVARLQRGREERAQGAPKGGASSRRSRRKPVPRSRA
jgi:hypothetical protein